MARLTIESVRHAINELQTQNKKPTNQNIVSFLGYGSFSTLANLRKAYPEAFGASNPNLPSTVRNTDDLFVNAVWQRIEPRVDKHVQSVLKQQQYTTDTVDNTELQTKFEQIQSELEMQKKSNTQLRTSLDLSRMEKSELSSHNNNLLEQLEVKQKALAKLVFLVTTGKLGKMLSNQELGKLIDLSSSDVANLKHRAKKYLRDK